MKDFPQNLSRSVQSIQLYVKKNIPMYRLNTGILKFIDNVHKRTSIPGYCSSKPVTDGPNVPHAPTLSIKKNFRHLNSAKNQTKDKIW